MKYLIGSGTQSGVSYEIYMDGYNTLQIVVVTSSSYNAVNIALRRNDSTVESHGEADVQAGVAYSFDFADFHAAGFYRFNIQCWVGALPVVGFSTDYLEFPDKLPGCNIYTSAEFLAASDFRTNVSYSVNDEVRHGNGLYRFTSAHSPGPWDAEQVEEITTGTFRYYLARPYVYHNGAWELVEE